MLIVYLYYIFNRFTLISETKQNIVYISVVLTAYILSVSIGLISIGIILIVFITEIFLFFYSELSFKRIWFPALFPALFILSSGLNTKSNVYFLENIFLYLTFYTVFILLSLKRGYLKIWNGFLVGILFFSFIMIDLSLKYLEINGYFLSLYSTYGHYILSGLLGIVFYILEMTLKKYELGYMTTSKALREQLLTEQYEEIQSVYLDMRGWRHDYHNHIQVLKATLENKQYDSARTYLDTIEKELQLVDTHVKSGNIMVDAILNSKLTLAKNRQIKINCEAYLPQSLFIPDVDLCTILGNILDNAIESCEKVEKSQRFIRVYLSLNQSQFYLSIQNAMNEKIDEQQKKMETKKKGNHGLGTKRVKAIVDKWKGFMSLNQQPGVFATEISIPFPD